MQVNESILEKVVELLEALRLQEDSSGVTPMILLLENEVKRNGMKLLMRGFLNK